MSTRFTIGILTTADPILRESAIFDLAIDNPESLVIGHSLNDEGVRRTVVSAAGVIEDTLTELQHSCLSCAIREDLLPTLRHYMDQGLWSSALVALPTTADSSPVSAALHNSTRRGGILYGASLSAIACLINGETVSRDAFSGELLRNQHLALTEEDDRVLGEALCPMVAHADIVLVSSSGTMSSQAWNVIDHLRGEGSCVIDASNGLDLNNLINHRHNPQEAACRIDPFILAKKEREDGGVWTKVLESPLPFHPHRLDDNIERLANHPIRTRGVFWVPTRPQAACIWDGAGGQLSIGNHGAWGRRPRRTRLVVTGTTDVHQEIGAAFAVSLVTPAEAQQSWKGVDDYLEDWLGEN